jgi:hypothetical protein
MFYNLIRLFGFLFFIFLIFAFNVLVSLVILSMLIVPATWVYSKMIGRSYNSVIDSSNMLYKLNKFGQWALVIFGSIYFMYLIILNS